eukprot:gene1417-2719_t
MFQILATLGGSQKTKVICIRYEDRLIARKTIKLSAPNDISKEADILSKLNSPYICKLIQVFFEESHIHLHLEAILAGPLHHHLKFSTLGYLLPHVVQIYAAELVSALCHMHHMDCVHRDIKANNCVIDITGHIKLCDFDKGKILHSYDSKSYTLVGTPHAMAPEMVARIGHSFEVDWWALGILVFEMITGIPPLTVGPKSLRYEVSPDVVCKVMEEDVELAKTAIHNDINRSHDNNNEEEVGETFIPSATVNVMKQWWHVDFNSYCVFRDISNGGSPRDHPDFLLIHVKDLIQRLLRPNPENRLGPQSMNELVTHPFFCNIIWEDIHNGFGQPADFNNDLGCLELLPDLRLKSDHELTLYIHSHGSFRLKSDRYADIQRVPDIPDLRIGNENLPSSLPMVLPILKEKNSKPNTNSKDRFYIAPSLQLSAGSLPKYYPSSTTIKH